MEGDVFPKMLPPPPEPIGNAEVRPPTVCTGALYFEVAVIRGDYCAAYCLY
jgi:hypothetical protein